MPALTRQQLFGANSTLTATDLTIRLADLAAAGLNKANPSASELAAALVILWKNAIPTNSIDDAEVGVRVGDVQKGFVSRSGTSQIEYSYETSFYIADTTATTLDPDDVAG